MGDIAVLAAKPFESQEGCGIGSVDIGKLPGGALIPNLDAGIAGEREHKDGAATKLLSGV